MTELERMARAKRWLARQEADGKGDRVVAQMLGCNHRTVGRGKPRPGRPTLTRGLFRYIHNYIEAVGWQLDEEESEGEAGVEDVGEADVEGGEGGDTGDVEADDGEGDSGVGEADDTVVGQLRLPAVNGAIDGRAPPAERSDTAAEQSEEQTWGDSPQDVKSDASGEQGGVIGAETEAPASPVIELPVVANRVVTKADIVAGWVKDRRLRDTDIQCLARRGEISRRARQQNLVGKMVAAPSVTELAALTAQARQEPLANLYPRDESADKPQNDNPLLSAVRRKALAALMETPALATLPVDVAIGAALTMARREVTLLDMPQGVHGDAAELLVSRAAANYLDEGAKAVGLAPGEMRYDDGLTAEAIRTGVPMERRMRRYAHETHDGRPLYIGERLADVIRDRAYRDEDWFFGSPGWTDADGCWHPGRAELIARWRLARSLYDAWDALERTNRWQYALYEARAEMELMLLHPRYGMSFDRLITGVSRWPRSTRLGYETNGRFAQIEANQNYAGYLRRRRRRRLRLAKTVSWTVSWFPALIFALRRDFALYIEKSDMPSGKDRWRELATLARRRNLYDRNDPSAKLPRLRETVLPALYEPVSEQGWFTRIVSWLLYRRHSDLDGSVCGSWEWEALDPPLTPEYMTPTPRTGYIPSEAFHRRFRPHEYEPGYMPKEAHEKVSRLRLLFRKLLGVGIGVVRGVRQAGAVMTLPYRGGRRLCGWAFRRGRKGQGAT